jgi:hypothetical protein
MFLRIVGELLTDPGIQFLLPPLQGTQIQFNLGYPRFVSRMGTSHFYTDLLLIYLKLVI